MEKIAATISQIAAEATCSRSANVRDPATELSPFMMAALVAWVADQPEPKPSLSDAIRRAVSEWLTERGYLTPETR